MIKQFQISHLSSIHKNANIKVSADGNVLVH